jgi:hypothetical protein
MGPLHTAELQPPPPLAKPLLLTVVPHGEIDSPGPTRSKTVAICAEAAWRPATRPARATRARAAAPRPPAAAGPCWPPLLALAGRESGRGSAENGRTECLIDQ